MQTPSGKNNQRLYWRRTFTRSSVLCAAKIITIITATIAVFYTDLISSFSSILKNEYAIYIAITPFIVTYLIYRKRKMLRAVMSFEVSHNSKNTRHLASWLGILMAATAILLYWANSYAFTPLDSHIYTFNPLAIQILALPIFVAGLVLIFFNQQTLSQLYLPLAFLVFLLPPPSETLGLALLSGFILAAAGTTIFLLVSRRAFKTDALNKNFANCDKCSTEFKAKRNYCRECGRVFPQKNTKFRKTDIAKIAMVLLVAGLLIATQSPSFTTNKITPFVKIETSTGSKYSPQALPETNQYSIASLDDDTYLEGGYPGLLALKSEYSPLTNESLDKVSVGIEIASTQSSLPPYNLSKDVPKAIVRDNETIQVSSNSASPVSGVFQVYNVSETSAVTRYVVYWIFSPVFRVNQTAQQKQVQTQLMVTVFNGQFNRTLELRQKLKDLATNITDYWLSTSFLPAETWAETLGRSLSDNGLIISVAMLVGIVATLAFDVAENRKHEKTSLIATSKLNTLLNETVNAVRKTKKPATLSRIVATFQEINGQTISLERLEEQLEELERLDIIRSQISGLNNVPVQTWRI